MYIHATGGKCKQVADDTGMIKLTFWKEHINTLTEDQSYKLGNIVVRGYQSRK